VPRALDAVDLQIGARAAVASFVAGAILIPLIALPIWSTVTPAVIAAAAAASLLAALVCVWLIRTGRVTEDILYGADFLWVAITAALVAGSAGRSSPFFLFYPLPVLHAGAFQSKRRLVGVSITATLAFLTPLLYDTGHTGRFVATAIMAVPPTLIVAWGFNVALTTLRRQRRELSATAARAEQDAHTDALTGLGNFRQLWSTLERETSRARRHGEHFSLIVIDLDRFKAINDEVGHLAGDAVLKAVGSALRSQLRGEDVCCRHGGDEFAVIAVGTAGDEAGDLAGRLLDAIATVRVGPGGAEHTVGAAAGWATFTDQSTSAEGLMREADAMLLERKYGRGR
jgi:diguanylate cyclase (GGDEF)-like protein